MNPNDEVLAPPTQGEAQAATGRSPSRHALRVTAALRWLILGLVTALAIHSVWTHWGPSAGTHLAAGGPIYYCPMHPEIRGSEPGECPICHMTLEPIPEERRQEAPTGGTSRDPSTAPHPPEVTALTIDPQKQRAIGLQTSQVENAALADRLRVPGVISTPETGLAQVRVRAAGFVEQVSVRQTGVRVTRGQVLASVFSPEIYRAQEEFVAASRWSQSSTEAAEKPAVTDLVSASRRGLELLGLSPEDIDEIARKGQPVRALPLRAPAAGIVTRFSAILGSRADPEMVLYEIADLSTVWVVASVHERELAVLRVGMPARFLSQVDPSAPIQGKIDLIEPLLEEATRTVRVRIVVKNPEGRLRPGQFGEVEIERPTSLGLFVPRDAVIRTGEHEYVYVAQGSDRFEPRLVRTGAPSAGQIQVLSGLAEGERVVTRGSFLLDSESRLQASLAATPAPTGSPPTSPTGASPDHEPSCEGDFDQHRFAEKFTQCRACELQHAGMGRMVADCKNAIPRPWR